MKRTGIRLTAVAVLISMLLSISVVIVSAAPSSYSTSSNSGKRNEVCVTLAGTSADAYYNGSYEYDVLSQQSASTVLSSLRTLMKTTHSKSSSYNDCKNMADKTDCENNSGKTVTIYTSYTSKYSSADINREHVWPKSLGGYETSGPGADLHHIRPSESNVNSNRGNLRYGNVSGGKTSTGSNSSKVGGYYSSSYFEPLDNVKGDVARICLYMYVRYGGESQYTCGNITKVFQSVDVLLEWCELDPVDTWEMGRNEVVAAYQGNRNVFIDYPEYAWIIFGREVPDDMTTPSGEAAEGGTTGGGNQGGNTDSGNQGGNTDSGNQGGNTDSGNQGGNTDSGNQGGNTGSVTDYKSAFLSASAKAKTSSGEAKFDAIIEAAGYYNKLTSAQKSEVASTYSELLALADGYNSAVSDVNNTQSDALKGALQVVITVAAIPAGIILAKKKFF